jgi:hypothetical protein
MRMIRQTTFSSGESAPGLAALFHLITVDYPVSARLHD